ncbi:ATR-interacting protein [Aplochiton taeniatus]
MNYPPSKRHKGLENQEADNTFGDDEDFTQDDLNEIDIIASQAFTGDGGDLGSLRPFSSDHPGQGKQSKPLSRGGTWTNQTRDNTSRNNCSNEPHEFTSKEVLGNGHPATSTREQQYYSKLEAQQAELKTKLREVEEEILMRNGEIRVLRDSLRVAQQEKEAQRQAHLLQEKEKAHQQNQNEKELSKKVQSLQSELHFKEAEMIEMKSKLQGFERGKSLASPGPRNSPRVHSTAAKMHHGSTSSSTSPVGGVFITKEMFGAQLAARTTPVKTPGSGRCRDVEAKGPSRGTTSDSRGPSSHSDPFISPARPPQHNQGSVLLSLLLQQPLSPSNLGLCHLLCLSPDTLPTLLSNTYLSPGLSVASSPSSWDLSPLQRGPHCSGFSLLQSLALSGLSMLALDQPSSHTAPRTSRSGCSGAIHLLPLLEHHISAFCRTLEGLALEPPGPSKATSPLTGSSLSGTASHSGALSSSLEECVGRQEEFGLAALRALCHMVALSPEVVASLLEQKQKQPQSGVKGTEGVTELLQPDMTPGQAVRRTTSPPEGELQSQQALLQRLLQLCKPGFSSGAVQREALIWSSLETLCTLVERAPHASLARLQCVLSGENLIGCLSLSSSYQTVWRCVSVLRAVADHPSLVQTLCSHTERCPFLKLFQFISGRPDKTVLEAEWALLEVEVVRFLTRLFTQRLTTWSFYLEVSCHCHSEVVQTLVVLLHRQWLDIRGREASHEIQEEGVQLQSSSQAWWSSPGVQLLRESLVLLHWLMLNHTAFTEHLRPVLHMYDQALPAVRDLLRKLSHLHESEELALEELCRSESDDIEEMDIDAGS